MKGLYLLKNITLGEYGYSLTKKAYPYNFYNGALKEMNPSPKRLHLMQV
jgi:hypothetical protein